MTNQKYLSYNINDTKKLAHIISKIVKPNLILLLNGPLGSGKTQFTKLIGKELGVVTVINSPTFIISNQYQTALPWKLIHIDAYRLTNIQQNDEYYELMHNNFTIIEWPSRLPINFNNYSHLNLTFTITNLTTREITITSHNLPPDDEQFLQQNIKKETL